MIEDRVGCVTTHLRRYILVRHERKLGIDRTLVDVLVDDPGRNQGLLHDHVDELILVVARNIRRNFFVATTIGNKIGVALWESLLIGILVGMSHQFVADVGNSVEVVLSLEFAFLQHRRVANEVLSNSPCVFRIFGDQVQFIEQVRCCRRLQMGGQCVLQFFEGKHGMAFQGIR